MSRSWRTTNGPWRRLRVGDRIRFVRMPDTAGRHYHRDTLWLFRRLIARGRALRICKIDEDRLPWIRCRFFRRGRWEHHALTVVEDCWVRVKPRRR